MIAARCSRLATRCCHDIARTRCSLLLGPLVCRHRLLLVLVVCVALLRDDEVVRVVQVLVQVMHDATCVVIHRFELLFKVFLGHDVVVAAERLDDLPSILVHCDRLAQRACTAALGVRKLVQRDRAGFLAWVMQV